jgi:hypothetical protein
MQHILYRKYILCREHVLYREHRQMLSATARRLLAA